jgi:transcriptional regulator with XRE-family HTH domain
VSRGTGRSHAHYKTYALTVAALIQKELDRAGVTPYRLAQLLGIHRGALSHTLHGRMLPTPAMLMLIAARLEIPVSRLLPRRAPR